MLFELWSFLDTMIKELHGILNTSWKQPVENQENI